MANVVIHDSADYSTWADFSALFSTKANLPLDARDGIGWVPNTTPNADKLEVTTDERCEGCSQCYPEPGGHIVPYLFYRPEDCSDTYKISRAVFRKIHKLLFELYYAGNMGFPGQHTGTLQADGGIEKYGYEIRTVMGNQLTLRPLNPLHDPRTVPICPNDVAFFEGGTNWDDLGGSRVCPIVDNVNYGSCFAPNYEFVVTLSCDCTNLLVDIDPPPAVPQLTICKYPRPAYTTLYAHELLPVRQRTITLTPPWNVDEYGAYILKDYDDGDCRISRPIKTGEIPVGSNVASNAPGTFRVRADYGGAWYNITSGFQYTELDMYNYVVWHWWKRIQSVPLGGGAYQTKVYLRNIIPNSSGTDWDSTTEIDWLNHPSYGEPNSIEILYYPEHPAEHSEQRYQMSMLCGNCKRDYAEWIGLSGQSPSGTGIDGTGRHWYCAARTAASGVANFIPGKCCLQRRCNQYYFGDPDPPTPRVLAEIDTAKWITYCQLLPGISWSNNFWYEWVLAPSLSLLAGNFYDTPTQYHGFQVAVGNGALGYWLYGDLAANYMEVHCGGFYDLSLAPYADYDDRPGGLWEKTGVTNTASFIPGKRFTSGYEDATSDPLTAHRRSFLRQVVSTMRRTIWPELLFFLRARVANWTGKLVPGLALEGENRVQRLAAPTVKSIYFSSIPIDAPGIHTFRTGTVEVGSWVVGGVEYKIKITVNRIGKSYGSKRLGGLTINQYGEDVTGASGASRGRVYGASYAASILTVDCYPGVRRIAITGNSGQPDTIRPYFAGGNVVELPDTQRPRSTYEFYTYNKFGDVQEKAYAGDTIEFHDVTSLADKRFYIRKAQPCCGVNFSTVMTYFAAVARTPGPFLNLNTLRVADTDVIAITGVYYWSMGNTTGEKPRTFDRNNAAQEVIIDYWGARTDAEPPAIPAGDRYYYRPSTDTLLFRDEAMTDAKTDYAIDQDVAFLKVRVYYTLNGGAEQSFDLIHSGTTDGRFPLFKELAVGTLLNGCHILLPYQPNVADTASNDVRCVNIFTGAEQTLTYQAGVALGNWPATGKYAFANFGAAWYMLLHPDYSGDYIVAVYKTQSAISSGNPPALPVGVIGFSCENNSYLLQCDRLEILDENALLANAGDLTGKYFTIRSDGVLDDYAGGTWLGTSLFYAERDGAWNVIPNPYLESAMGILMVAKSVVDTWDIAKLHCFRVESFLVGGM